jgi:hypothetical protein
MVRRLAEQDRATLSLDGEDDGLDCRVASVSGPLASLVCIDEIPASARHKLANGSLSHVLFRYHGAPVGLRGVVRTMSAGSSDLEFVVIDGVQLKERRAARRVPLLAAARLTGFDDAHTVETELVDLSLGGAMLKRPRGAQPSREFELELFIDGDGVATPVRCHAELARQTLSHLSVRFVEIEPADQIRLAKVVADRQRRLAHAA